MILLSQGVEPVHNNGCAAVVSGGAYWELGRLGPNLESEELQAKREKAEKIKLLAAEVR